MTNDSFVELQLELRCPDCGHQWSAILDISTFFWEEINNQAKHLVETIHTLARAYGWRETDILSMSPWRRQLYLEMVS